MRQRMSFWMSRSWGFGHPWVGWFSFRWCRAWPKRWKRPRRRTRGALRTRISDMPRHLGCFLPVAQWCHCFVCLEGFPFKVIQTSKRMPFFPMVAGHLSPFFLFVRGVPFQINHQKETHMRCITTCTTLIDSSIDSPGNIDCHIPFYVACLPGMECRDPLIPCNPHIEV